MSVSARIKALLSIRGEKQSGLIDVLGMSSKQSLSNKFTNNRWSADDLIRVAGYAGCKLAFILPNGEQILLEEDEPKDT